MHNVEKWSNLMYERVSEKFNTFFSISFSEKDKLKKYYTNSNYKLVSFLDFFFF